MISLDLSTDRRIVHAHLIHDSCLLGYPRLIDPIFHLLGNHAINDAIHLLHFQLQLVTLLLYLLH